jgi:hypothetical protein
MGGLSLESVCLRTLKMTAEVLYLNEDSKATKLWARSSAWVVSRAGIWQPSIQELGTPALLEIGDDRVEGMGEGEDGTSGGVNTSYLGSGGGNVEPSSTHATEIIDHT